MKPLNLRFDLIVLGIHEFGYFVVSHGILTEFPKQFITFPLEMRTFNGIYFKLNLSRNNRWMGRVCHVTMQIQTLGLRDIQFL